MFLKKKKIPDGELVALIIEGDEEAFEALFLRYYPTIRYFIEGMVKDHQVAEDMAQTIFIRLWLGRLRLHPGKSVKNYLFVAAKNEIINYFKSAVVAENRNSIPAEDSYEAVSVGNDVEEKIFYNESRVRIGMLIDSMPPVRRDIFRMSREEKLSNQEIADRLGISVRTVEKQIQLALRGIRSHFS